MSSEIEVVEEMPEVPVSSRTHENHRADGGEGEEELQQLLERFGDRLGAADVESLEPGVASRRRRNVDDKQEHAGFFLDDIPAHKRVSVRRNPKLHARRRILGRVVYVTLAIVLLVSVVRHFLLLRQPMTHDGGVHLSKHLVTEIGGGEYLGRKGTLKGRIVDPVTKEEGQVEVQQVEEGGEVSEEMELEVTDPIEREADADAEILEEVVQLDRKRRGDEEVVEEEVAEGGAGGEAAGIGGGEADSEVVAKDDRDW